MFLYKKLQHTNIKKWHYELERKGDQFFSAFSLMNLNISVRHEWGPASVSKSQPLSYCYAYLRRGQTSSKGDWQKRNTWFLYLIGLHLPSILFSVTIIARKCLNTVLKLMTIPGLSGSLSFSFLPFYPSIFLSLSLHIISKGADSVANHRALFIGNSKILSFVKLRPTVMAPMIRHEVLSLIYGRWNLILWP